MSRQGDAGTAVALNYGGKKRIQPNGTVKYDGGKTEIVIIEESMLFPDFVGLIGNRLELNMVTKLIFYSTKADRCLHARLRDQLSFHTMFATNKGSNIIYVYVQDHNMSTESEGETSRAGASSLGRRSRGWESMQCEMPPNEARDLREGQVFRTVTEFKTAIALYAADNRFEYKTISSRTDYRLIKCTVNNCPWSLSCGGAGGVLSITKLHDVHEHKAGENMAVSLQLPAKEIGKMTVSKLGPRPHYLPRDIGRDIHDAYAVTIPYMKMWRAKKSAKLIIEGEPEHSYRLGPWLCTRIEQSMPGSKAIYTEENGRFKQLFVAYGASIRGFESSCHPIVVVDSCHLSGYYHGCLFAVTAADANDNIYPLAYGILSSDNDEDWLWFMRNLKLVLSDRPIVLITDRNQSLVKAVAEVFGADRNAWCLRHLRENFGKYVSSKLRFRKNMKDAALSCLDDIAYARTETAYNYALTTMHMLSPTLATWVTDNGPEHWSNAKFPHMRWDIMYTNSAESYNNWVNYYRDGTITEFILGQYHLLCDKMNRVKADSSSWSDGVGERIEDKIAESLYWDLKCKFIAQELVEGETYNVKRGVKTHAVDLGRATCTCLAWQQSGIPCMHASTAIRFCGANVYQLVDIYFFLSMQKQLYSETMQPFPTHDMPMTFELVNGLMPPITKRKAGRPRKKRIESQHQHKQPRYCSRCVMRGHNIRTCINPIYQGEEDHVFDE